MDIIPNCDFHLPAECGGFLKAKLRIKYPILDAWFIYVTECVCLKSKGFTFQMDQTQKRWWRIECAHSVMATKSQRGQVPPWLSECCQAQPQGAAPCQGILTPTPPQLLLDKALGAPSRDSLVLLASWGRDCQKAFPALKSLVLHLLPKPRARALSTEDRSESFGV